MKRIFLIFAVLVVASVSASAGPVFLTPGETASFVLTSSTGLPAPLGLVNASNGFYSVNWDSSAVGAYTATSGFTLGAARGVAGDTFTIILTNNNGSPWNFSVSINNGALSSGPFMVANGGGSRTFTFVLPAGGLTQVSVTVGATLPIGGTDRGAEYRITSVPEPTSMLLLGTGLLGAAGAFRRRFKARS